jgi:hypothetical protein
MPLDPSIPLQFKGLQLDNPMDVQAKVMNMSQLARQGQIQEQQIKKNEVEFDLEKERAAAAKKKELAWSIQPGGANWAEIRQAGIAAGYPNADKLPEQYPGDDFAKQMKMGTLTALEQLEQMNKQRGYDIQERQLDDNAQERRLTYGLKLKEVDAKTASGENLPIDAKHEVNALATKNAGKVAIKNQIDAVMGNWDNLTDEQKITTGRSLLKTLNSTEGADAIGAEEAKRLGGFLEFRLGNFTEPGAFVGRDLKGFKEQATNASTAIGSAVKANQAVIDQRMGRSPKQTAAFEPDVLQYAQKHNITPEQAQGLKAQRMGASNVAKGK